MLLHSSNSQHYQLLVDITVQLVEPAPVSQRSWIRISFRPEFFQALISQLPNLRIQL